MNIERRALAGIELRAEQDQPTKLVGHAAVFNSRSVSLGFGSGEFVEIIRPGAFANSLKEGRDVLALVEHDTSQIIGRRKATTLAVGEDDRGLRIEITPPDTQVGRDVVTNVKLGNLDSMSFAFRVRPGGEKWDMTKLPPVRELLDLDLEDVSVVALAAYPQTDVALRSLQAVLTDAAREAENDTDTRRRGVRVRQMEAL